MGNEISEHLYSKKDLDKAFTMGLEYGICVLENSMGLSPIKQRCILEHYKKIIESDKVASVMSSKCPEGNP